VQTLAVGFGLDVTGVLLSQYLSVNWIELALTMYQ
jgi:hypothetical protein